MKEKYQENIYHIRLDVEFTEFTTVTYYYSIDEMFSKLGGLHAAFFSVIEFFAPLGMLYFLFNLAFYVKKHHFDEYSKEIIHQNKTLYSKMQEFRTN